MKPAAPFEGLVRRMPAPLAAKLGWLNAWLGLQQPQQLCAQLELKGWRHVVAAEDEASSTLLRVPATGPWQIALWAVAFYRGPVDVVLGPEVPASSIAGLEKFGIRRQREVPDRSAHQRLAWVGIPASTAEETTAQLMTDAAFLAGGGIRVSFEPQA